MFNLIYFYTFITIICKYKPKSVKRIFLSSIIYLIINYILSLTTTPTYFIIYLTSIIFYKILLKRKDLNYYLLSSISLIGLITTKNKIISIIYLIVLYILKEKISKLINYINNTKKLKLILIALSYLTILIYYLFNPITLNKLSNIILILLVITLIITVNEQMIKLEIINKKYQELKLYSKNNDNLVTNYRAMLHENKNQLIIIKGMLKENKEELNIYLDNLINKNVKVTNKWLNDLRYIPIPGIKNFVNYKLIQLENMNTDIEIYISKELEKIKGDKINVTQLDNFYTIIGVLLDNMIDSIKEQKEKLVSINIYMEDNVTNIELANTYKNYIDINKLYMPNYTTKGNNHGVGLYLVNKIIKNNKEFELNTRIDNEFFVQHLKIYHSKKHLK